MKWIKVTDELPNYDFEVLVCDKFGHVTSSILRDDSDESVSMNNMVFNNVTHWMPFPYPPKKTKHQ